LIAAAVAELPDAITAPGEPGDDRSLRSRSNLRDVSSTPSGNLVWQFREPIAALFVSGKTTRPALCGPTWELIDGSVVRRKGHQ
jgi:hypothetical protein